MKKIFLFSVLFCLFFSSGDAWFFDDFIDNSNPDIIYCDGWECWLDEWIQVIKGGINDIETERSFSEYVQDIVRYLLMFLSIVSVIYIMYAGFQILIWNGDEEKLKHSRSTIVYVAIGLVIIWLAWPITLFILNLLNVSS